MTLHDRFYTILHHSYTYSSLRQSPLPSLQQPMPPLSAYEAVTAARCNAGVYKTYTVGAQYKQPLSKPIIAAALALLCNRFPAFSLCVGPSPDYVSSYLDPYTIGDDLIDVVDVEDPNMKCADDVVRKYVHLDIPLDGTTPLWRCVYYTGDNVLFFYMVHVFFDGTAAKNFHLEFAKALDELEAAYKTNTYVDTSQFKPFPSMTDLLKFQPRYASAPAMSSLSSLPAMLPPLDTQLLESQPMYMHNYKRVPYSKAATDSLIVTARLHGVKLTALLYAFATKSIVEVLGKEDVVDVDGHGNVVRTFIPVNTRFMVGKDTDSDADADADVDVTFGQLFGKSMHVATPQYVADTDTVQLARSFQVQLTADVPNAMHGAEVFETAVTEQGRHLIDESMHQLAERNGNPGSTLVMSNLGVLAHEKILDVYFDQPMVDACFALHFVSSATKGISLSFTSHRAVPVGAFKDFVERVVARIDSVLAISTAVPAAVVDQ
jgi:hypothetical protein